jgi:hypothetical protein
MQILQIHSSSSSTEHTSEKNPPFTSQLIIIFLPYFVQFGSSCLIKIDMAVGKCAIFEHYDQWISSLKIRTKMCHRNTSLQSRKNFNHHWFFKWSQQRLFQQNRYFSNKLQKIIKILMTSNILIIIPPKKLCCSKIFNNKNSQKIIKY